MNDASAPSLAKIFGAFFVIGATSFEDDTWNAHIAVPQGEIGNRCRGRNQKDIFSFLCSFRVITENLYNAHAGILIINEDIYIATENELNLYG